MKKKNGRSPASGWTVEQLMEFFNLDIFEQIIGAFYSLYWRSPTLEEFIKLGFIKEIQITKLQVFYTDAVDDTQYDAYHGRTGHIYKVSNSYNTYIGQGYEVAKELGIYYEFIRKNKGKLINHGKNWYKIEVIEINSKDVIDQLRKQGVDVDRYLEGTPDAYGIGDVSYEI